MNIDLFDNPNPQRDFTIQHVAEEFTSVCPVTGQPDFGKVILTYTADAKCIELKSYKLYLQGYRNQGIFYEAVTNKILDDLVALCSPRWMKIETVWTIRGGIHSKITAEYKKEG
jgi:7-cyano-7-deazaguanine reductase